MNLIKEIEKEHSKAQCIRITEWVGNSSSRFETLFSLFIQPESKITQRAAWSISYCLEQYPNLLDNHFAAFIKKINSPNVHDAIKRNGLRALQFVKIPKKYQGLIIDLCFQFLESPKETVAVKVYAMYVLTNLAKVYPEITPEINLLIEMQIENQSAAFKSAAKTISKKLKL